MLKNKKILNRLKRILNQNKQDVEDVIQDSFVKFLEKKDQGLVITKDDPKYYFYAILNNMARTKITRDIKKRLNEDPIEDHFNLSTFNDPIKLFVERDIERFSNKLTNREKIVFNKRLELDSHKEVAEALNKEYMTCKAQWRTALEKFKKENII